MTIVVRRKAPPHAGYELVSEGIEVTSAANAFLDALGIRGLSLLTTRAYAYDLVIILRWLATTAHEFESLREADLLEFVASQRTRNAAPASINRRLVVCRLLYRFVTGHEMAWGPRAEGAASHYKGPGRDRYLGLHPIRRRGRRRLRVKEPCKLVEPLRPLEVRQFLRGLRRYRDAAIVYLMLLCGLRSREVIGLELIDVDFVERSIRVLGKGNKERVVPLPDLLARVIRDYLRLERPTRCRTRRLFVVFRGPTRGQPMTPEGLRSLFRRRRKDPALGRAHPHRFRHTFGADMARSGVRLPVLQRLMGHADSTTTMRYINLSVADVADEFHRAVRVIEKRYEADPPDGED